MKLSGDNWPKLVKIQVERSHISRSLMIVLLALSLSGFVCGRLSPQPTPVTSTPEPEQAPQIEAEISRKSDDEVGPSILPIAEAAESPPTRLRDEQGRIRETRAVWTWDGRFAESKEDIDHLVELVDLAHLNVILFGVYAQGTTYFEPSHNRFPDPNERLTNQSPFAEQGYPDSLSYLLKIRDERRMDDDPTNDFEVQAWFTIHQGGVNTQGWPPPNRNQPYMLNSLFPEFQQKFGPYYQRNDKDFVRHDVSVMHQPKFRAYMTDLITGLFEDYNVDGVHLDFIRTGGICFNDEILDYPGTAFDYLGCQADYRAWTEANFGRPYTLWQDTDGNREIQDEGSGRVASWLEDAVNQMVEMVHTEVKKLNPNYVITAAIPKGANDRLESAEGQAPEIWLEQGWVDAVFILAYYQETQIGKLQQYLDLVSVADQARVFAGLAVYDFDTREPWDNVFEQIDAVMFNDRPDQKLSTPLRGVGLFRGEHLTEENARAIGQGPFAEPAVPFWGEN